MLSGITLAANRYNYVGSRGDGLSGASPTRQLKGGPHPPLFQTFMPKTTSIVHQSGDANSMRGSADKIR